MPLALADNGHRWHLRAFDRLRQRFADFVLTRITRVELLDEVVAAGRNLAGGRAVEPAVAVGCCCIRSGTPGGHYAGFCDAPGELNLMVRAAMAGYT